MSFTFCVFLGDREHYTVFNVLECKVESIVMTVVLFSIDDLGSNFHSQYTHTDSIIVQVY